MTIRAILQSHSHAIETCAPDSSVASAVAQLAEKRIGALPVVADGEVLGVFSERDVIYCLARDGPRVLELTVREVMTAPAVTAAPDGTADEAMTLMTKRRIRHLPVLADGAMIGLVSIGDLVKYRIEAVEAEASAMRDYIQTA